MERTNFTFVSTPHWLKALTMLFVFGFWGAQQSFAQCDNDSWAPVIVYPSQDINVTLDPCDPGPAIVFFEITVTDDCDGDHVPSADGTVTPGSEFAVTVNPPFSGGLIIASPGGATFAGVFEPGAYQILIEATDAAGNTRQEDFFVTVTQDAPVPTNLSCISDVNVTLNADCQRLVTPGMVLSGEFGCASPSDFQVNIVNDDDPTNGPVLDGCGEFIYEVTYVGPGPSNTGGPQGGNPQTVTNTGFTGDFAAANWTIDENPATGGVSDVAFTTSVMTITTFDAGPASAAIAMPRDGNLQFDWEYSLADFFGTTVYDELYIDVMVVSDGSVRPLVEISTGSVASGATPPAVFSGSIDEDLLAGDVVIFIVNDDNFAPIGNTLNNVLTVDNFTFSYLVDDPNAPTFPFFNWEDCWGYVNGEDKAAPALDCPDNTSTGTVSQTAHVLSGSLGTDDEQLVLTNYSCFLDGSGTAAGNHYYELTEFQVSEEDFYTFYLQHEFATDGFVAIYQGSFNPDNPCENIIAQVDDNFLSVNGVGFFFINNGGGISTTPFDPVVRTTLPLRPYETYYLLTSTFGANDTGDYDWIVFSDGDGWLGEWDITTTVNPQTWEETVTEDFNGFPTQQIEITLPLYCEDFDAIFNNPASLSITGSPVVSDNCDSNVDVSFVDTYSTGGDCAPIIITRRFTAVDDKGNSSTCTQTITLNRPNFFNDIQLPPFTVPIECDEYDGAGIPQPEITGYPFVLTINGIFNLSDTYCNLGASFSDGPVIDICSGAYKVVRTWDILDWCNPNQFIHWDQIIKVGDFTPPSVTCPGEDYDWDGTLDPLVISTSPFSCTASFSVPLPSVTDNCSDYEVHTEIVTEVEVEVTNQYGQVTGTRTDTVVVRVIAWNAPTRLVSGIPAGNHYFRYTVEDDCGNKSVVYCPFSVKDQVEPTAICDDNLTISIGGNDFSRVYATDIDEGSNDNCEVDRIEVRRNKFDIINYTCGNGFSNWGPYVDFFCCDVGVTVTIELRVIDKAGNINTCWLEVTPEEKARPYCYAPHPVMIDCDALPYSFDPLDTLQLQQLFGDATSEDNCGSYERELPPVPDLECGFGTIIRRFRATDVNGNESVNFCQQVVTIKEKHNYEIKFPADAEAVCGAADPDSVIYEEIGCDLLAVNHTDEFFSASGDECYKIFRKWKVVNWCQYDGESDPFVVGRDEDCDNQPGDECVWVLHRPGGYTYIDRDDDETEPNNVPLAFQNICNGIDDFWRKVDYDGGFFQYTQIIKVYDDIDPEISSTPEDFCSYDNVTCTGLVNLDFTIFENCTPDDLTIKVFLDAGADGTIDFNLQDLTDGAFDDFTLTGTYPDYTLNGRFPIGCHAFEVHVEDGCGNVNSELLDFCVVDCKAPSPVCINGLAIELMPVDLNGDDVPDEGRMAIWANDFIVSPSPDCTGPIKYSINRVGDAPNVDSTGIVLTCADTGTLVVEIWAYDGAGNSDFCETYILVQDNMNLCGPGPLAVGVSGAIATEDALAVENVEVSLSGQPSMAMMTVADGEYAFAGLQDGYDYTVTPQLNANYLNGVSTFDLVLISKHILGVQPLGSPYKMIAADVNNSKSITTLDLIQLRKLILSIDTEFENNTSWRFVEAAYSFPNASNPWFEEFPEVVNINNLPATGITGADFVAVKIGDVNNDAQANALAGVEGRTMAGTLAFNVAEAEVKAGNEYTVAFTAADIASVEGYQATLSFDNSALELVDIIAGVATAENFGLAYANEGLITTSWNGKASADAVLFSLVFRATADAQLSELLSISSRVTKAEAYRTNGDYLDVAVTFSGKAAVAAGFELYQNTPNPFKGETLIGFNLPADDTVTLTVSDVTGKVLKLARLDGVKGYNNVVVNSNDLPAAGVLYYTVETSDYTATKKMVIIE